MQMSTTRGRYAICVSFIVFISQCFCVYDPSFMYKVYKPLMGLQIPSLAADTTYEAFFENHLLANKPCIFEESTTSDWKCREEWVNENGEINIDFLDDHFGDSLVPVSESGCDSYGAEEKRSMMLRDYLEYLQNFKEGDVVLYLKDWHFVKEFPESKPYTVPIYFESDYLADYSDTQTDDFKFLYLGPPTSSTPPHTDVYSSYSWSANIVGRKLWYMISPEDCEEMIKTLGHIPADLKDVQRKFDVNLIKMTQNSGEIIFVPSGWLHQVTNLENTLSVNQNWFNSTNLVHVWKKLKNSLNETEAELEDLQDFLENEDWRRECQKLLKVNYGMDYLQFLDILDCAVARLSTTETSHQLTFRRNHELKVLKELFSDKTFLEDCELLQEIRMRCTEIKSKVEKI